MLWSGATAKSATRSSGSSGSRTERAGWSGRPGSQTSSRWLTSSSSQTEPSRATSNDHGPKATPSWPFGGWEKPTSSGSAWAMIESGVRRWPNRWTPSATGGGTLEVAAAGWTAPPATRASPAARTRAPRTRAGTSRRLVCMTAPLGEGVGWLGGQRQHAGRGWVAEPPAEVGAPAAAALPGDRVRPGLLGHLPQHPGQHQDLDRRHQLPHLLAAVVGAGGGGGQQVDELGDLDGG